MACRALCLAVGLDMADASPRTDAARQLALAAQARARQADEAAVATRDLQAARAQADRLADQRAQEAASLRQVEAGVVAATMRWSQAAAVERAAEAALARSQADFARLIPLMLRLRVDPVATMLTVRAAPAQAVEGLMIMRGLAIDLAAQAADLRARRDQAARLRLATAREAQALATQRARQDARAAALDQVVAQANGQVSQAEAAGREVVQAIAAAAGQAATLHGAIAAMDAARSAAVTGAAREAALAFRQRRQVTPDAARARQVALAPPSGPAPSLASGRLLPPVAGTVLHGFAATAEDGPATGITFGTAPSAFVSSPCAGRVAFAAPFRSYGRLIILECGGGTDMVLAGLGRLDTQPGHAVRPGEPLGRMPATPSRPALYVELRVAGRPVDPAPFLHGSL